MITLRLPGDHPNSSTLSRWATDKENLLNTHIKAIAQIQGVLKTILTNNPDLGKN